jgi:glycosyltransferase involved in cell wall biosynthesis
MRILTVTHYQPPHRGGIEMVAAALAERYRAAGHEVVWLASDLPPVPAQPGQVRVPAWNGLEERLGVPYPIWDPRAVAVVRRWVDWCDVVHCHDCLYLGTVLALTRARRRRKPVLLTQHVGPVPYGSVVLRAAQRLAYATIGRYVHSTVDQVVFISHTVSEWFRRRTAYRRPPRFIANGIDAALFQYGDAAARRAARQRLGLSPDQRVLLFVGRFVDKKGLPIVKQLVCHYPDVLFLLIGEGPIDPRKWQYDNVVVRSFQPQRLLPEYYWASDACLLPSSGEGFPLVVMEAMACGTPTIIPTETFAAWNHGREYFLVSEPTATSIAALLGQRLSVLATVDREAISTYARSQWDWSRVAQEYLSILTELQGRNEN